MRRLLPLVLLLATLPAPAGAEEEPTARLDLAGATVLVSPGVPPALAAALAAGRAPQPICWPLPEGPVLLLGLPGSDPLARRVADVFSLPVDPDGLAGGYRLWAWREGTRSLAFLFGADPAALQAARLLFEADAPAGRSAPDARSLDFRQPNEEAGLLVPAGEHVLRPRYRIRALAPGPGEVDEDAVAAAGGHANRLWIEVPAAGPVDEPALRRSARRARALGVEPVASVRVRDASARTADLCAALRTAQGAAGIRHVALRFERPEAPPEAEAACALAVAEALRPRGLDELLVVPARHSDRLVAAFGPPPDLADLPEALVAWSGPSEHCVAVTRAQAERRVAASRGVPVVLHETWAAPFQGAHGVAHPQGAPTGRDEDLGEVLEGIVVLGRGGTADALDQAWHAALPDRFGADLLAPLLPPDATDAGDFLLRAAERLEATDRETFHLARWMAPLAATLRAQAAEIARGRPAATVPRVPAAWVLDGRVDERPWAFARRIPLARQDVTLLAMADGASLRLALRVGQGSARPPLDAVDLWIGVPAGAYEHRVSLAKAGASVATVPWAEAAFLPEPGHVGTAVQARPDGWSAEVELDRFALFGDASPPRCLQLWLAAEGEPLWPAPALAEGGGLLVLVP